MNEDTSLSQLEVGDLPDVFNDLGPKFRLNPEEKGRGFLYSHTQMPVLPPEASSPLNCLLALFPSRLTL